ncbi:MAG: hypothetical protein M3Q57_00780, partial [Pseudomonadota bacterium]|nr:hypothetical protein [Pseudomonadota bacterium]
MYLVADNALPDVAEEGPALFARWQDFPVSHLSHHGGQCCEAARRWFGAMDFAQLNGSLRTSGPRWIRHKYNWGPSAWPLHWCDALKADSIDCGAHAALAEEAFSARGVASLRAQFVQSYDSNAISQWRGRWGADGVSQHWLADKYIYHEGNAVLAEGQDIKLWDGSAGSWITPGRT